MNNTCLLLVAYCFLCWGKCHKISSPPCQRVRWCCHYSDLIYPGISGRDCFTADFLTFFITTFPHFFQGYFLSHRCKSCDVDVVIKCSWAPLWSIDLCVVSGYTFLWYLSYIVLCLLKGGNFSRENTSIRSSCKASAKLVIDMEWGQQIVSIFSLACWYLGL